MEITDWIERKCKDVSTKMQEEKNAKSTNQLVTVFCLD